MMPHARILLAVAKAIQVDVAKELGPPEEGQLSATQEVVPRSVVRDTRGYIEQVANQANGAYEKGWYDACAVMIRRLLETLIIEAFEQHGGAAKIKTSAGDFMFLGG